MIEQLIVFLPVAVDILPDGAAVGRRGARPHFRLRPDSLSVAYAADPAKRSLGFGLGALPTVILLVGALVGVIRDFLMAT